MSAATRPTSKLTRGLVLGKFMPPHRGHQFLIDFARHYVDSLTVLVCTLDREPIDGNLRFAWMRAKFPDELLVHVTDEVPQTPEEHPEFWRIWRELVLRHCPDGLDYVFASESYGERLAMEVGAEFVPVDIDRELRNISGTAIRTAPLKHWDMLPEAVRPHYLKRVCIFGPESTGKSTLAKQLAEHFDTSYVFEYARPLLDPKGGQCDESDIARIARGQVAAEDAMAQQANRVLFCDTNVLLTVVWSETLFGRCESWIRALAAKRRYDLTLLLDVDVPWVDDEQRYFPDMPERRAFFERCRKILVEHDQPFVVVSGDWAERFELSVREVAKMMAEPESID